MATSKSMPIPVRYMDLEFGPDVPENWGIGGNEFLTAIMAAFSASFPAGETYFIHTVNHYLPQLRDDRELMARVRGFAGQEGQHTKEHLGFNRFLDSRGFPASEIEKRVEDTMEMFKRRRSPAEQLAHTVALEHLTAFLAAAALEYPEIVFDGMHPMVAALWGWHLIEEFEHRSVAFDVYKRCVDDEKLRVRTMAITTVMFSLINLARAARIMKMKGHLWNFRSWKEGWTLMAGDEGPLRKLMPMYWSFYDKDFHPDDHDVHQNLDMLRARFHDGFEKARSKS